LKVLVAAAASWASARSPARCCRDPTILRIALVATAKQVDAALAKVDLVIDEGRGF
jgi:hypothetical protein